MHVANLCSAGNIVNYFEVLIFVWLLNCHHLMPKVIGVDVYGTLGLGLT